MGQNLWTVLSNWQVDTWFQHVRLYKRGLLLKHNCKFEAGFAGYHAHACGLWMTILSKQALMTHVSRGASLLILGNDTLVGIGCMLGALKILGWGEKWDWPFNNHVGHVGNERLHHVHISFPQVLKTLCIANISCTPRTRIGITNCSIVHSCWICRSGLDFYSATTSICPRMVVCFSGHTFPKAMLTWDPFIQNACFALKVEAALVAPSAR